jgi:hypothetical protein
MAPLLHPCEWCHNVILVHQAPTLVRRTAVGSVLPFWISAAFTSYRIGPMLLSSSCSLLWMVRSTWHAPLEGTPLPLVVFSHQVLRLGVELKLELISSWPAFIAALNYCWLACIFSWFAFMQPSFWPSSVYGQPSILLGQPPSFLSWHLWQPSTLLGWPLIFSW